MAISPQNKDTKTICIDNRLTTCNTLATPMSWLMGIASCIYVNPMHYVVPDLFCRSSTIYGMWGCYAVIYCIFLT